MFFPFGMMCCGSKQASRKTYQTHKLEFLKAVRDSLETQLASVNAAISTVEDQLQREETTVDDQAVA